MATSVVPSLIDALVTLGAGVLPNLQVFDGMGITDSPGDYLMVGVEDPDVDGYASTAETQQDWANANYTSRDEEGDIRCAALSWNGNADQKAARDAAYATIAALETALRQNPTLSLAGLLWTSFGGALRLNQIQDDSGAVAIVLFSIHFKARI